MGGWYSKIVICEAALSLSEENATYIDLTIERLELDELASSLGHAKAAAELLDSVSEGENTQLEVARLALRQGIDHGQNAVRAKNVARTQLGLYLLAVQTGISASTGRVSAERALALRPTRRSEEEAPGTTLELYPERVIALPRLMGEERNLVWVRVHGKLVPLLESRDDRAYQGYIDSWQAFREAGLPVPPLFLRGKTGTLLIPEVKEDGSEVYGTGLVHNMYHGLPRERPRPEIDEQFIQLTSPQQLPAVEAEVRALVEKANGHNLQLPAHDPFQMVVRPDGSWELVIRDLRAAKVMDRYPYYRSDAEVHTRNEQSAALWFARIRVLRQFLTGEGQVLDNARLRLLFNTDNGVEA